MQGLWLTSAFSLMLFSACANEKFRDQGSQTQAPAGAETADTNPDAVPEPNSEDASMPTDVTETTADADTAPAANPLFADCQTTPERPIVGDLYQLAPNTRELPDYHKMKALKKVCLAQLDIKTRSFTEGFPGVEKLFEWFSLDMRFAIKVPKAGKWEFKLVADDGAILYIDQTKVIDNDGVHETKEKTGRSQLTAGLHEVRVSYFQGPRYNIALELYWKGPHDNEFTYIPAATLLRPQDARLMSVSP
ncbi:MAG TPA: PA14 domain-containing protein [Oligoflexus sp.]|uniref:PA14 domain-containing protein n=1 Tax=Oligoflexus sp. TaxID=1971216 RepID=UPI002D2C8348|nr:PA14 domain-containing protein [Oligoflexus sp.]HYX34883.1 PA14 domain-containing protein [Oligoflexus sp.]